VSRRQELDSAKQYTKGSRIITLLNEHWLDGTRLAAGALGTVTKKSGLTLTVLFEELDRELLVHTERVEKVQS